RDGVQRVLGDAGRAHAVAQRGEGLLLRRRRREAHQQEGDALADAQDRRPQLVLEVRGLVVVRRGARRDLHLFCRFDGGGGERARGGLRRRRQAGGARSVGAGGGAAVLHLALPRGRLDRERGAPLRGRDERHQRESLVDRRGERRERRRGGRTG